jgi:hypothetical protein
MEPTADDPLETVAAYTDRELEDAIREEGRMTSAAVFELGRRAQREPALTRTLASVADLAHIRSTRLFGHGLSLADIAIMDLIAIDTPGTRALAYQAFESLDARAKTLLLAYLHTERIEDAEVASVL